MDIAAAPAGSVATARRARIVGFDLARALAILAMFIVNFNTVFGSYTDESLPSRFMRLFNGNASTLFVILAGMGVALMTSRAHYTAPEKRRLRSVVVRRSWFLFALGLALYTWWPADILHFYGGYMHLAALVLFVPRLYYVLAAVGAVVGFHLLWLLIPFDAGWNFNTLHYVDFWTPAGFLRNTVYNGWNPIFPWAGFFFFGMWLGRLNWQPLPVRRRLLLVSLGVYGFVQALQLAAGAGYFGADVAFYLTADYLPPFLPFMLSTGSLAVVVLIGCLWLGERYGHYRLVQRLAKTGQMTLTHYVVHLTVGLSLLALLTGQPITIRLSKALLVHPVLLLGFALGFYALSVGFSSWWSRRYAHGPFEALLRWVSAPSRPDESS